jgi:hypothetical protein
MQRRGEDCGRLSDRADAWPRVERIWRVKRARGAVVCRRYVQMEGRCRTRSEAQQVSQAGSCSVQPASRTRSSRHRNFFWLVYKSSCVVLSRLPRPGLEAPARSDRHHIHHRRLVRRAGG